jgi:hypothetical protein
MAKQNQKSDDLMAYIKDFFENPKNFQNKSFSELSKNWFMLNRFLAKGYPLQSNALNNKHVKPDKATLAWFFTLKRKFKRTPKFIFAKSKTVKSEKEKSDWEPSYEIKLYYAKKREIPLKVVNEELEMFPEKMKKKLKNVETSLNDNVEKN